MVVGAGLVTGCLTDMPTPPTPKAPVEERKPPPPAAPVKPELAVEVPPLKKCPTGVAPAADGLVDDFEDNDAQLALSAGRTGYWWVAKADNATVSVPGTDFKTAEGGPEGSKKAVHFAGETAAKDPWGAAVGVNFLGSGFYDASKYVGLSFKIKASAAGLSVRLKLPDVNTHPDGGVCQDCWNAFGKDLELTDQWQTVQVLFEQLEQQPSWGKPRPSTITSSKIKNVEWAVDKGTSFDFWLDDIQFLDCK